MSTEQLYTFAMVQLTLVLLLASTRLQPLTDNGHGLRYFKLALACDVLGWFCYLWPQQPYLLLASSTAAAFNIWLLLLYAFCRVGRPFPWFWIVPAALLQALLYNAFSETASLHLMTLTTAMVALPSAWLFCRVKANPSVSDKVYALVMLCWFLVCLVRSIIVEVNPELILSGYLVSQLLWPGITAAYAIFAITGYLEETQHRLREDAMLDPLTGLLNRRGLQHRVQGYLAYMQRMQQSAAVLLLDLDHFKRVNDRYGHDCGDQVLIRTAQLLRQLLRQGDLVARWGGEEFLIILPNTDQAMAEQIAHRICTELLHQDWQDLGLAQLTTSIGGAFIPPGELLENALRQADTALYQAKAQGRNQYVIQPSPVPA